MTPASGMPKLHSTMRYPREHRHLTRFQLLRENPHRSFNCAHNLQHSISLWGTVCNLLNYLFSDI